MLRGVAQLGFLWALPVAERRHDLPRGASQVESYCREGNRKAVVLMVKQYSLLMKLGCKQYIGHISLGQKCNIRL